MYVANDGLTAGRDLNALDKDALLPGSPKRTHATDCL
jgi:hypothetical protein